MKTRQINEETIVFRRKGNDQHQILRLDRVLCLPIGAKIELVDPNINIRVTGVRLLADGTLCLDVEDVPGTHP